MRPGHVNRPNTYGNTKITHVVVREQAHSHHRSHGTAEAIPPDPAQAACIDCLGI